MIQFVGEVKSKKVRHQLIDAFVDQLARPSHGDRNKGIYNLLGIANAWPSDRGNIRAHGGESIRYLAENSILFNVKPPAQELLALVDQNDPRGALRRYRYDPKIEEECLRAITLQGLLVGLLPLVCTAPALAFSSGITARSGNPATNGGLFCNSCHAGGAAPEVTLTGPSLVATGSTHDLVLAIRGGQEVAGGLDVSATGGTLFPIDPGTRLQNGEITHLSPRNVDAQGTVSFTVRWTAPSTPGTVTLYAAGNSVNRNFGPSGDLAATTTQVINVADTVPAPGEAAGATLTPLLVTGRDAGTGLLSLSYGVACAATGHRLYVAALAGPPAWSAAVCEIGATGSYAGFDPGSGSIAFIVVAHDGSRDGSYGLDRGSGGIETERAPAPASLCSAVQDLAQRCDAAP